MPGFLNSALKFNERLIWQIANNKYHNLLFSGSLSKATLAVVMAQDYNHMWTTAKCWEQLSENIVLDKDIRRIYAARAIKDRRNASRIKDVFLPKLDIEIDILGKHSYLEYNEFLLYLRDTKPQFMLAGLMPCYLLYQEIYSAKSHCFAPNNPHQFWVDQEYGELAKGGTVKKLIDVVNDLASNVSENEMAVMEEIFAISLGYEKLFFERAMKAAGEVKFSANDHSISANEHIEKLAERRAYETLNLPNRS